MIIFDCDGVLVDSEPLAAEAYERVYDGTAGGVGPEIIAQCIGMKQAGIAVKIRDLTGHHFPDHAQGDIWAETKGAVQRGTGADRRHRGLSRRARHGALRGVLVGGAHPSTASR